MPFTNQHPAPSSSFSPRKYQIITPSRNLKEVLLVVVVVVDIHTKGGGLHKKAHSFLCWNFVVFGYQEVDFKCFMSTLMLSAELRYL